MRFINQCKCTGWGNQMWEGIGKWGICADKAAFFI